MNENLQESQLAEQLEKALLSDEYNKRIKEEMENLEKLRKAGLESIQNTPLDQILTSFKEGDAWSTYNLGLMHLNGIKVNKDLDKALQLFQLAQERKHSMAKDEIKKVNELIAKEKEDLAKENEKPQLIQENKKGKKDEN